MNLRDYAIFLLDLDWQVVSWNEGARRLKGYDAHEIIGQHFSRFYMENDRHTGQPEKNLRQARQDGRYEEERWRVRKDGSLFWASVTITAISDEHGAPRGFAKVTRDLTAKKEAEEALRERSQRALQEEQEQLLHMAKLASLGELAAGIAHELNTPLHTIGLFVGNVCDALRAERIDPQKAIKKLDMVLQQVDKAATIIDGLRLFSRTGISAKGPVHLNDVVQTTLALVGDQLRLRQIEVQVRLAAENPVALGNAMQLEQVLLNLLTNAKDALEAVSVKQVCIQSLVKGKWVELSVVDSGPGMPPDIVSRIFDPFFTTKEAV